ATRKAIDAGRARSRRPVPVAAVPEAAVGGEPDMALPDDPLWEAVRDLPAKQRVAVVTRVLLDRSYADVAAAMGTTEEAARANVYQGLKRLRTEVTHR